MSRRILQSLPRLWGGLLCVLVALVAQRLSALTGLPLMLLALLSGLALHRAGRHALARAGVEWVARHLLRWGIALLGLRISLDQVMALGWPPLALAVLTVMFTMGFGLWMARRLGLGWPLGLVSSGAVGICGASAALAVASCLPRHPQREQALAWTLVGVSVLSSLAMLLYPWLMQYLGWGATETGLFLGATIHDVAQVAGAAYGVSTEAGDVAIVMKLMRVAMLVPVMLVLTWGLHSVLRKEAPTPADTPLLPGFVVAFMALVLLQKVFTLPAAWLSSAHQVSSAALLLAMGAIGLKLNPGDWQTLGWRPMVLMLCETLFLAAMVLCGLMMARGFSTSTMAV